MSAFIKTFLLLGFFLTLIVPIQYAVQFPIQDLPGNYSLGSKVTTEDYPADDHGGALETFSQWFSSDDSTIQSKLISPISSRSSANMHALNFGDAKKGVKIYRHDIDNEQLIAKINDVSILNQGEKGGEKEDAPKDDDQDKDVDKGGLLDDFYVYNYGDEEY